MAGRLADWIETRLPVAATWRAHASEYLVPKNLNFWYIFGVFSLALIANQIITGIWLTMYYTPTEKEAFASVEHIMRHVNYGWLLRYMHTTGASLLFISLYLHIYRGILYGSSKKPRELVWIIGVLLYLIIIAESATGYSLPWGQMSFWAIKVLLSVFSVIPYIGEHLVVWLQGDYNVSGITLHRFFSLHVIAFPLLFLLMIFLHIMALHTVGSNNPDGIDIDKSKDAVTFHPYYTVKDGMALVALAIVAAVIIFYMPKFYGYFIEYANYEEANALVTPEHIAPPWYLAPFYAILRSIPSKIMGIVVTGSAIFVLFLLPWLDRSPVRSMRYKGLLSKLWIVLLVISFGGLGLLGTMPLTDWNITLSRIFAVTYFSFFLLMPWYTRWEKTLTTPQRVSS